MSDLLQMLEKELNAFKRRGPDTFLQWNQGIYPLRLRSEAVDREWVPLKHSGKILGRASS